MAPVPVFLGYVYRIALDKNRVCIVFHRDDTHLWCFYGTSRNYPGKPRVEVSPKEGRTCGITVPTYFYEPKRVPLSKVLERLGRCPTAAYDRIDDLLRDLQWKVDEEGEPKGVPGPSNAVEGQP